MSTVLIVAIVFGSILTFAALVCGTILAIIKMRSNSLAKGRGGASEEARIIQELYQGLNEIEKRIETLETILMDDHNTQRKNR